MDSNTDDPNWLTHQWVMAGIVSSAARFVPIPFVDDIIRNQCRRFVVTRTLAAHGKSELLDDFKPFYDSGDGCLTGCVTMIVKAPLRLLLFPVRKMIAILTSVRGVPLEITRMVLLGRTLDRQLRRDSLTLNSQQSTRMRSAFDESFARMDFHVVRATVSDALSSVNGWKSAAMASAQRLIKENGNAEETIESEPKVDDGATHVQSVLGRPETLELFAEFDRRFDAAMNRFS